MGVNLTMDVKDIQMLLPVTFTGNIFSFNEIMKNTICKITKFFQYRAYPEHL